ncbi:Ger(x)C family spore germination protein [Virgibacillus litoralis]|uniref:Spore germination protein n=1 Tax=Virgibacillus litoralis TaxID=578221 RepID=A0ABS4H8Z2_9BACI|nr:Ger(x)C family spore germination protein [Virgibacillus litoralis]MBP1947380.1 spore germination protein [Virgibacillus litoralis]
MRNTLRLVVLSLLLITSLTGCVEPKSIEDLGIINTRGVDIIEDDKIETTLVIYKFDSQNQELSSLVFGEGKTIKGARQNANYKTSFQLTPGQIRFELFGKETAEKGLLSFVDTQIRDARVSDTMYLAISETTAKDVITQGHEGAAVQIGKYLFELIEQNVEDNIIPRVTLQDFLHIYYDYGHDPYLPVLSTVTKSPTLSAIALFQDDKYVGQVPLKNALLINVFNKSIENASLEVQLPMQPFKKYMKSERQDENDEDTAHALMKILRGNSKTKLTNLQNMQFQTEVTFNVTMLELSEEIDLKNPKVKEIFEKEVEKNFKKQYEQLFKKLQEFNSDPFGYGTIYRINKPGGKLTDAEWHNKFPDINVDFKIEFILKGHGTTP